MSGESYTGEMFNRLLNELKLGPRKPDCNVKNVKY